MRRAIAVAMTMGLVACSGADGAAGLDGVSYVTAAVPEAAGANCANGGYKLQTGPDNDRDGKLSEAEATSTSYLCNGAAGKEGAPGADGKEGPAGKDGKGSLSKVSAEAAGMNCTAGGLKIESGVDTDGNATLDTGEVTATNYVCNGASAPGTLTNTTTEPAGTNCTAGGVKIESGVDTNKNSTLDTAEVTSTKYACNGTAASSTAIVTANVYSAGQVVATAGTDVTVAQLAITAPAAGKVLAIASVDVFCSTATGTGFVCGSGTISGSFTIASSATAASLSGEYDYFWLGRDATEAMTRSTTFTVGAAGTYTYYVRAGAGVGQIGYFRPKLTLIYLP